MLGAAMSGEVRRHARKQWCTSTALTETPNAVCRGRIRLIRRCGSRLQAAPAYQHQHLQCRVASSRLLPVAYCIWPMAHCIWPMAYCIWPIAYCIWPKAYGLLHMAYGLWPVAYCRWPMAYCLLPEEMSMYDWRRGVQPFWMQGGEEVRR